MDETKLSELRQAVENYKYNSPTTSASSNTTCTVGELKKLHESTAELFKAIVNALGK